MTNFKKIIENFKNKKIIVIGEAILDEYVYGEITRISPEAPVPIVKLKNKKEHIPGGAANVATNIASLGGKVILLSITGDDENCKILEKELDNKKVNHFFVKDNTKPTITKTRIIGNSQGHLQHITRLDNEINFEMTPQLIKPLIEELKKEIKTADCVVLSDYNKGVLTEKFYSEIIKITNDTNVPVVIDPKPKNIQHFKDCTLIAPNIHEAEAITGIEYKSVNDLKLMADSFVKKMQSRYIIITCGKDGMFVYDPKGKSELIPTKAKEVVDVSGAGDSAIAVLALSVDKTDKETNIHQIVELANNVAAIAVSKLGTSTVSYEELINHLE